MACYTEHDIQAALNAIASGIGKQEAAREYGILPTTLQDCIK
jgi:hypothetical protein